jgi:L,D-transpeptidase catalytic domain
MRWYLNFRVILVASLAPVAVPCFAQDAAVPNAEPAIVFKAGTGDGSTTALPVYVKPPRPDIGCDTLGLSAKAIEHGYYSADAGMNTTPKRRLARKLFAAAIEKYRAYYCSYGRSVGPAAIVIVDFAKHSSEPRLYRVDLRTGDGLDTPIHVAHGIGSDPDNDGFANVFSNVQDSLTSSLGAARGGERYVGQNGISLRLDGLEPSNSQMRARDIVVHSYQPERRRYFNADFIAARGKPGSSEGCFVVEPDKREWILDTLENGGFLYSGYSGQLPQPIVPVPNQNVVFVRGTGANPQSAPADPVLPLNPGPVDSGAASGTPGGMPGTPPTTPILPAPKASAQ